MQNGEKGGSEGEGVKRKGPCLAVFRKKRDSGARRRGVFKAELFVSQVKDNHGFRRRRCGGCWDVGMLGSWGARRRVGGEEVG